MNAFSEKLLTDSYIHYLQTSDRHFVYEAHNGDELLQGIAAGRQLYEDGYITNISDNIFALDIDTVFDTFISFDLTDVGAEYAAKTKT